MIKYTDYLKIGRVTLVSDTQGGQTESWDMVSDLSDVLLKCKIRQLSADEIIINNKMAVKATHRVYCSDISLSDTRINAKDRLCVKPFGENQSDVYEVSNIDVRRSLETGENKHLQVDCLRII